MLVHQGFEDFTTIIAQEDHYSDTQKIFYRSGVPFPIFNGVFEKTSSELSKEEIEACIKKMHGLPFVWWTDNKILEDYDFVFGGKMSGITLEIQAKIEKSVLDIHKVESDEELQLFVQICCEVFEMSHLTDDFYRLNQHPSMTHFIAYVDGEAAGAVSLTTGELMAGIWNLATTARFRRQGIGSALVQEALHEAQSRSYTKAMAILMPEGMAAKLFEQQGFVEEVELPFFVYGVSS